MTSSGKWNDLRTRCLSAAVMLFVGLGALFLGGLPFHFLIALVCGGMAWELTRMMAPQSGNLAVQAGAMFTGAVLLTAFLPPIITLPLLLAAPIATTVKLDKGKPLFAAYAIGLILACYGLSDLRQSGGMHWVLWQIAVVVATDVAGYFAGKAIGGPKFWPSISPKKTWSGTAGGWVAAALVGLIMFGPAMAVVSALISFASQLGDIAESSIKRRAGVKDSSNLIPGHGGLLDRFDGLMAAALLLFLISTVIGLPQ